MYNQSLMCDHTRVLCGKDKHTTPHSKQPSLSSSLLLLERTFEPQQRGDDPNTDQSIMPRIHQQLQEDSPRLISNLEVLEILRQHPPHQPQRKRFVLANAVAKQVEDYLQGTPCVRIQAENCQEIVQKLRSHRKKRKLPKENGGGDDDLVNMEVSTGFGLTHAEAVQCLNIVPTERVELHLLVDDVPGRFSETQQDDLLEVMKSYDTTPSPPDKEKESNRNAPSQKQTVPEIGSKPTVKMEQKDNVIREWV
jgi:hypothetical protein